MFDRKRSSPRRRSGSSLKSNICEDGFRILSTADGLKLLCSPSSVALRSALTNSIDVRRSERRATSKMLSRSVDSIS